MTEFEEFAFLGIDGKLRLMLWKQNSGNVQKQTPGLHHLSSQPTAKEADMASKQKTLIVTGASQGIGAGVVQSFLNRGYNVVANSRNIRKSDTFIESDHLALVDGSIGESAVASKIVETAVQKFGSIDALVNNAGIFFTSPFTDYTAEDFKALSSTNLEGFLYVT
jgi:NAD(P)-dependent dehydrogenase (short-subunit alcohol dehydrogenase family)